MMDPIKAYRDMRKTAKATTLERAAAMTPQEVVAVINRANAAQRSLRALTGADADLERLGALCGEMKMNRPWDAVLVARRAIFGERFAGLRLCEIEDALASNPVRSATRMLGAYEAVAFVIERQLKAVREGRAALFPGFDHNRKLAELKNAWDRPLQTA